MIRIVQVSLLLNNRTLVDTAARVEHGQLQHEQQIPIQTGALEVDAVHELGHDGPGQAVPAAVLAEGASRERAQIDQMLEAEAALLQDELQQAGERLQHRLHRARHVDGEQGGHDEEQAAAVAALGQQA